MIGYNEQALVYKMKIMKKCVVCLASYPEPGMMKKQLAFDVGITDAAKVQSKFIKKIIYNHKKNPNYDFFICLTSPDSKEQFLDNYTINEKNVFYSQWTNIGEISKNIFWELGQIYDQIILIGTDIPTIDQKIITKAFYCLNQKQIVIWPTLDGKSYLFGINSVISSSLPIGETRHINNFEVLTEKLAKLNISYETLETKRDIKSYKDLLKEAIHSEYYQKIISMVDGRIIYRNYYI